MMEGRSALLGISRAEIYHQFGVPDVNYNSILVYGREEKVMILCPFFAQFIVPYLTSGTAAYKKQDGSNYARIPDPTKEK